MEEVRGAVKRHINRAWSGEAVRCGVGCAKAGESWRGEALGQRWECLSTTSTARGQGGRCAAEWGAPM